ncbi:MAG: endonuclease domain-containing protein [Actinomycetota bacterium]|nr:endonuclease domain-containing protein [Actinomycetota bacterium]
MEKTEARLKCRKLALAQYGLMTRSQALGAGLSRRSIDWQLKRGNWHIIHPQVYVLDGIGRSWEQSILAACLWGGHTALASHRSAAALWGLADIESSEVEISTTRSLRSWNVITHRMSPGAKKDTGTKRKGIPLTSVDQTLLDLGGVIEPHRLEVALDDALNRRLTTLASLESAILIHARRGRPGSGALRPLVKSRTALTAIPESALETQLLGLLQAADVPLPIPQHEIRDGGRFVARVDFAYPDLRIAIEADGYRHHSGRHAWQRDLQRRNHLTAAGWLVLHVTWRDLDQRPKQLIHEVRQMLSIAGAG